MARKPRVLQDGATYHVMCQVNRRKHDLKEDIFKDAYLDLVEIAEVKFNCKFRNFCIMDNHVHLEIFPEENNLSRIMQWIQGMFTRTYNKITGECGRLWRGRFKSRIITDKKYEVTLFEYISFNPSRVNPAIKPAEYKYSGIYCIIRKDFRIIEKPDPERLALVEEIYRRSEDPVYFEEKLKMNQEIGFYPGRPGRKPGNKKAA